MAHPKATDVNAVHDRAREQEHKTLLGFGTTMDAGSVIAPGAMASRFNYFSGTKTKENQNTKNWAFALEIMELQKQIAELSNEIQELNQRIAITKDILTKLKNGETTEQQALQNAEILKVIQDWEKRTGKKYGDDPDITLDIVLADQLEADRENVIRIAQQITEKEQTLANRLNAANAKLADQGKEIQQGQSLEDAYGADAATISQANSELRAERDTLADAEIQELETLNANLTQQGTTEEERTHAIQTSVNLKAAYSKAVLRADSETNPEIENTLIVDRFQKRLERLSRYEGQEYMDKLGKLIKRMRPEELEAINNSEKISPHTKTNIAALTESSVNPTPQVS